jgi:2-iminoacetate synthase
MSFTELFNLHNWDDVKNSIFNKTERDVELAISSQNRTTEDFKALISPAAVPYLEEMAQLSRQATQRRFGKTIQMYTPLYLSNVCCNHCIYCGFNCENKIKRKTLSDEEIMVEAAEIKKHGFDHILLVTGEAQHIVNVEYFKKAIELLKPHFSNISFEVQPLDEHEYSELNSLGAYAVLVYQETYNKEKYPFYHPGGKKADFLYRIETPDRIGKSYMHKIGLGVLLGLEDWRTDSYFCALHLDYLQKTYWQTKFSVSFPRLRPAKGAFSPNVIVSDRDFVQLICAYRLFNEDVELSISTRERDLFRNNIIKLGITSMSAGSKTNPGGYAVDVESLEQFEISDERSSAQVASYISSIGYEPVWKDWDRSFA